MRRAGGDGGGEVLVLGVGNVLRSDDGVATHVLAALERCAAVGALGPDVRLLDGGTAGFRLVPEVARARRLVVVDAAAPAGAPGTIRVSADVASCDDGPVADLLAAASLIGRRPATVTLVAVEAGSFDHGTELTAPVAAAIPAAVRTVLAEIGAAGEGEDGRS